MLIAQLFFGYVAHCGEYAEELVSIDLASAFDLSLSHRLGRRLNVAAIQLFGKFEACEVAIGRLVGLHCFILGLFIQLEDMGMIFDLTLELHAFFVDSFEGLGSLFLSDFFDSQRFSGRLPSHHAARLHDARFLQSGRLLASVFFNSLADLNVLSCVCWACGSGSSVPCCFLYIGHLHGALSLRLSL